MKKFTKNNNSVARDRALKVFLQASKNVPAYKKFLQEYKVDPKKIIKNKDLDGIPITDKDNYLRAFPPFDLVPGREFPPMVSSSSGSSGRPYYWP
ncbi:MAG: hypothetical protein WC783_04150, partial [Candidatus Paceibacterota bacterium]